MDELTEMVATVIKQAGPEKPADEVLRRSFQGHTRWPEHSRREVSRAVFDYYRWLGWLDKSQPLSKQIAHARELAGRFAQDPASFPDTELVQRTVPAWAHDELTVTAAWARTLQREPVLWLRARRRDLAHVKTRFPEARSAGPGPLAEALEYRGDENIFVTEEFHRGEIEIQDLASQLVGVICAPEPGQKWWDACAGEGGKTLHLSELMSNQGLIWATDRAGWRLDQLKRRSGRAGVFNYRSRLWTGTERLPTKTVFDGVLLDAPCSGLGTWQRNPHARWTTTPVDVAELQAVQKQLLGNISRAVRPGGRLIYAVCTLTRSETEAVAGWFEETFKEFEPLALSNPMEPGGEPGQASPPPTHSSRGHETPTSRLWLWPQDTGGNGMFVAGWRRKSA